jgi:uncharacterized protein YkwD
MRYLALVLASAVLLALAGGAARGEDKGADKDTKEFFNGKDLDGWEGLKEYWSVKDGAIVGNTPKDGLDFNTFLCSKRRYADLELTFQVRLTGDRAKANSGVQIRSSIFDHVGYAVRGPQCDMGQQFWGSLYGEHFGGMMKAAPADLVKKAVKPGEFNDYSVRCVGKHVTIKINGETTVDDDFPKMPKAGIVAWQLHAGPHMEVTFRNIKFRALSEAGPEPKIDLTEPPIPAGLKLTPQEEKIYHLINEFRAKGQLTPLKLNVELCKAARAHSENMAKQNKLDHVLDGKGPNDRAKAAGYTGGPVSENIAGGGKDTPKSFFELWVKSPGHRANLLGEGTEVGIGFAPTADGNVHYYTAMFSAK